MRDAIWEGMMAKAGLLFVGTDDGAVLFSNPNNIGRWLRIGQPFRGQAVQAIWPLPDNPLIVFAAVAGMGLQRSDDGGQSWRSALDADVAGVVGHHNTPNILCAWVSGGELYFSEDAGEHWDRREPVGQTALSAAVALAPDAPRRLYVGQADGVWISSDAGATWGRYGEQAPQHIQALAAHPAHSGRLYAVAASELYSCDGAEGRWQRLASAPPAAGPLAILAGQQPVLLLSEVGAGIARYDETSASWSMAAVEGDWGGAVAAIAPVGYHIDTAFAGSASGRLAISADRGRTWQPLKQDLPPIRAIAAARLV
jgi:photosystem II stability/assembly factor-like uncharacterized protein